MANEAKIVVTAEDRARKILEGVQTSLGQVAQKGESLNSAFARLGPLFGSAFAATTFTAFIKSTANSIDALNDVKDATGSTIENISALEDTALRTGGSLETVTTSLIKLNQVLGEADPGSDKAKVLQAIGLSARELRALDPADALEQVARALATFADDGNKARVTQELFGKSLREVAPFLNDLAERGKKNATVTEAQAKAAEDFNKQLAELEANSLRFARAIGAVVIPQINKLFTELEAGREAFGGTFEAIFKLGTEAPGSGVENLKKYQGRLQELRKEIASLEADGKNGNRSGLLGRFLGDLNDGRLAEVRKQADEVQRYINYYERVLKLDQQGDSYSNEGRTKAKPSIGAIPPKVSTPRREEIDASSQALAAYVQQLEKQLQTEQQLTDVEQAKQFLRSLGAFGEIDQVREVVLQMAKKVTVAKQDQALTAQRLEDQEKERRSLESLNEEIDRLTGKSDDERKAALTAQLEKRIREGEEFSAQQLLDYANNISGAKKALGKDLDEMGEFAKQAARTIQSELGENLEEVLGGHFNGILNSWGNLIKKMAAQALSAQLSKALLGDFDKTGDVGGLIGQGLGYLGQYFGGATPSAKGNAFDANGMITAFAGGGVFDSPTAFSFGGGRLGVMGEAGPEAVMPLQRGPDGKLGVAASGAQQPSPTFVFNIASGVTRHELMALIPQIKQMILAEEESKKRRASLIWGAA